MAETKRSSRTSAPIDILLWIGAGVLFIALLFARLVWSEIEWLSIVLGLLFVADLGLLVKRNFSAMRSRQAAFGFNSTITILLVIAIVGVLNFLAVKYPQKLDLTKSKINTLNDQTVKVVKGLQKPVKAAMFTKVTARDRFKPLFDSYKALNSKFEVEYVDPDREPTRAKTAGIKKYDTLQLTVGTRESKVEEITEEKVTNALIKLLKERSSTLCTITGHGEKSFGVNEAEGYAAVKKGLLEQSYEVKDFQLLQDAKDGKIPLETCDAVAVIGPTKSFVGPEVKILGDYLRAGGRAIFALDVNVKGGDYSPELTTLLAAWNIKVENGIIVDPVSKMIGVDAAVPVVASYSREHAITKDFQPNSFFPFVRPVSAIPAGTPDIKATWIAQTTPQSWAVTDTKQLASGQIRFTEGRDRKGPISVAVASEGRQKDASAPRPTRLVVFGTALMASNQYSHLGGNLDLFLNAVSWTLEDESLISIRARDEESSKVELTQKAGMAIFLITVVLAPLVIAVLGVVNWVRRRKL